MTLGTREFSKEAKSAIAVMRSLIISEKGTSSLYRILGDFRKEEGQPLMYKNFGYPTAAAFLEATGQFILREQNGEIVVFVKPSEESSHIQKMIAAQKSTKPRAVAKKPAYAMTWNKTPYQRSRYPGGQFQQPKQQSSYQQQSKTCFSSYQPSKPASSYQGSYQQAKLGTTFYKPQQQKTKPVASYQQQQRYKNSNNPLSSFFGNDAYGIKAATGAHNQPATTPKVAAAPPTMTPARPNNSTNPFLQSPTNPFVKPDESVVKASPASIVAPTKTESKMDNAPAPSSRQVPYQKMDTTENHAKPPVRTIRQSFNAPVTVPPVFTPESIVQVVQAQQQNLIEQQVAATKDKRNEANEKVPPSCSHSPMKPALAPFQWDQPGVKPEDLLFKYGQSYGSLPVYKFFEVNKRFLVKVTINGTVYRTYPHDYPTELESKSAVAQVAIDAIRRTESRNFRECNGTDAEIADMIYDLLLPCQYGMQLDNIPYAFRDAHGSMLPKHWKLIVQANLTRLFKIEEVPNNSVIVFTSSLSEANTLLSAEAQRMAANFIKLPWSEPFWDLYVTHPVSPNEIWARLVGPEYSDRMADLMTSIEESMAGGAAKQTPEKVTIGEYYLVQLGDCWHRVRVERLEPTEKAWECFFIDLGGTGLVAEKMIHMCEPRFLELPGQTVCFALEGLQELSDDPTVEAHLQELVDGKVLIGQVYTTEKEYDTNDDDMAGYGDIPIRVTLHDTSNEMDDVNINDVLRGIRNECRKC